MCLSLIRSLWSRIRLLKSLNIPHSPLQFGLGADHHSLWVLVLAWTRFFWYKQNTSLLSDTHHTKFILLLEQDLEEVLSPGQKTLISIHLQYSEKHNWTQYRGHLNLWSAQQYLHRRQRGKTCNLHAQQIKATNEWQWTTQVKRGLETSRRSERRERISWSSAVKMEENNS